MRRMHKSAMVCATAAVSSIACSPGPSSYLVATPSPETAFSCALRKINEMDYTVSNSNREAGFIAAEKARTSGFSKAMTGRESRDQLTVSIFDADSAKHMIRVTASSSSTRQTLLATSTSTADAPSDKGVADANDLLLACGQGPVKKQEPSPETQYAASAVGR